ncbi:MAG TPA: hypothetical protein IAC17_07020 [Candidatus Faecousia faecipullorum]|nr:hypothetical protein [Candidatus Faecousia faecipullorum]
MALGPPDYGCPLEIISDFSEKEKGKVWRKKGLKIVVSTKNLPVSPSLQKMWGKFPFPTFHLFRKASQSLPPEAAKKVRKIFRRGVYLAENTSQAPSVEFVPHRGANYARRRLQKTCQKAPQGDF